MLRLLLPDEYPGFLKGVIDDLVGDTTNYAVYAANVGYKVVCDRTPLETYFFIAEDNGFGGDAIYYNDAADPDDVCLAIKPGVYEDDDDYQLYVTDGLIQYTYSDVYTDLTVELGEAAFSFTEALEAIYDTLLNEDEYFGTLSEVIQYQKDNGIYPFDKWSYSGKKIKWLN